MTDVVFRRPRGFTILEIVIAIAISVVMISAVYNVTRALSDTTRRQRELSVQLLRREKFAELLRRDLRGLTVQNIFAAANSKPISPTRKPGEDPPVLQFNTLADGLSTGFTNSGVSARALTNVQYFISKNTNVYNFVRVELAADGGRHELVLLQSAEQPRVEFFVGKNWVEKFDFSKRPAGVRLRLGSAVIIEVFLA